MATIIFSLSSKADSDNEREARIRFIHGKIDQQTRTGIFINPGKAYKRKSIKDKECIKEIETFEYFDTELGELIIPIFRGVLSPDKVQLNEYLTAKDDCLSKLKKHINNSFKLADRNSISPGWLKDIVGRYNFPEKYAPKDDPVIVQDFFESFDEFLKKRKLSDGRERGFMVLKRALLRYELIRNFKWHLDSITCVTIKDFENFLLEEHSLYDQYKSIYDEFPDLINSKRKTSKPQPRGMNYINALFRKLRAFFNWCNDVEKTTNKPFKNYESTQDLYGSPIYIDISERNQIYETDLSHHPNLAVQRDIFCFQCLTGSRVGDLFKMTKQSVIGGAIEYIPRKTKDGHPITVRVPLNDTAMAILKRYESDDARLLPFISEQKYNEAIKEIFLLARITRTVTVINPVTREEEKRPINEVASSHMARRTFIGNLYKLTNNADLTGTLSGHTDGSKSFFRYRTVDEEKKIELVKMLE